MSDGIRRVVTGHDDNGKAIIVSDGVATNILQRPNRPGVTLTNFWQTFETPAPYAGPEESLDGPLVLKPPANGTVFRFITFDPEDPAVLATLDGKAAFAEMDASYRIQENTRHPFMHRTNSVDYAVIVSGKIIILMNTTTLIADWCLKAQLENNRFRPTNQFFASNNCIANCGEHTNAPSHH